MPVLSKLEVKSLNKNTIHFLKNIISVFFAVFMFIFCVSPAVLAVNETEDATYDAYTYWYNYNGKSKKAVLSRPLYNASLILTSADLGVKSEIAALTDSAYYGNVIYLLDNQTPQIIMLNSDYTLKGIIPYVTRIGSDKVYDFKNASGIFVNGDGIYIADTENKRVLVCTSTGEYKEEIFLPESDLLPDDFNYMPVKLSVDGRGYLYVLSEGCYEGAILYSPEREFLGFYGSNKVKGSLTTALKNIYNKVFVTDAKKGAMKRSLPYQFNDLFIDGENFVYTSTGNTAKDDTDAEQVGQIKRISPGGKNILNSEDTDFTDSGISVANQNIVGLEVDSDGYIYALDAVYGHIFIYDSECTMITCLGNGNGSGIRAGSFKLPTSLCINGSDIVVTDNLNKSITVFTISDYGALVKKAQGLTVKGNYKEAFEIWKQVQQMDSNSQLAYIGMGKGYYDNGDYSNALKYSKLGCDRETYSLAFEIARNKVLKKFFVLILVAIIAVCIALKFFGKRLNLLSRFVNNLKIKTFLRTAFHPADSFTAIKEKKCGSVAIGVIITVLYYVTAVLSDTCGGFAFTYFDSSSYNSWFVALRTSGLILLFIVSFWCVSTLFGGLGKLKDIFIVTSYSCVPIVFGNIVSMVLTNILVPNELGFLNVFIAVMAIYTGILLMFGLIIINDFEFGKFFGVTVLAVIAMVIILFLVIVIIMLLQLLWGFIGTVASEILKLYR